MKKKNDENKYFQKVIVNNIDNIITINNKYKNKGYNIFLTGNYLEVYYCGIKYSIKIIKKDNQLYWRLIPYNNAYFETKINNELSSLDMVMFAIYENEIIHERKEKK